MTTINVDDPRGGDQLLPGGAIEYWGILAVHLDGAPGMAWLSAMPSGCPITGNPNAAWVDTDKQAAERRAQLANEEFPHLDFQAHRILR